MADCPPRNPAPPATGPFDQIRCSQSRQLLADGYRAAVRALEIARSSIDPSNRTEEEA